MWAGKLFCLIVGLSYLIWRFLEWYQPKEDIDIAIDFPYKTYETKKHEIAMECKLPNCVPNFSQPKSKRNNNAKEKPKDE